MMLALPTSRNATICAAVVMMLVTALGPQQVANAQGIGATGKQRVLLVPMQRGEGVSSIVPGRVDEYIRTLLEMSGKMEIVGMDGLVDKPSEPKAKPVQTDKYLVRADEALWKGKEAAQKGKFGQAIKQFKRAAKLYEKRFDKLVDFDKYIDAALGVSLSYFLAGYEDNGEDALAPLLVLRPNLILDKRKVPATAIAALERLTRMYSGGTPGKVTITSTPPGAEVFVDGNRVGMTPHTISGLYRGRHVVRLVYPDYQPMAKSFTAGARNQKLKARMKPIAKARAKGPAKLDVGPDGLIEAVVKGTLHRKFSRIAKPIAERYNLDAIALFYVRHTPTHFEIAPFLYDKGVDRLAELEWIHLDHGLTTMQVNLLVLDEKLNAALANFPKSRTARRKSKIYQVVKAPKPKAIPKPEPPLVLPKPKPKPKPVVVASKPKTTPKSKPKPVVATRKPRRTAKRETTRVKKRAPRRIEVKDPSTDPVTVTPRQQLRPRHPAPANEAPVALVVALDDGLGGNLGAYPYPDAARARRPTPTPPATRWNDEATTSSYTPTPKATPRPAPRDTRRARRQAKQRSVSSAPPSQPVETLGLQPTTPKAYGTSDSSLNLDAMVTPMGAPTVTAFWYEQWWVWTLIGAAVAGGATAAAIFVPWDGISGGGDQPGYGGTVQW